MNGRQQGSKRTPDQDSNPQKAQAHQGPTATQWSVGGVAVLLVLAAIAFLAYHAWTGSSLPPLVTVRVERILEAPDGYVVELTAANTGGTTAQGVTVEGTLRADGRTVETSATTLQWIPARAERAGGLFFTLDPRQHQLELRPKGYERP